MRPPFIVSHSDEVLALHRDLTNIDRDLSYERQAREVAEKALVEMTARVKAQQTELADQERQTLALVQEVQALRNANFRLEKAAGQNSTR